MDISKLTPPPWEVSGGLRGNEWFDEEEFWCRNKSFNWDTTKMDRNHCEFISLSRQVFDIESKRMKEGWFLTWYDHRFVLCKIEGYEESWVIPLSVQKDFNWQNPFTAWYEGDKWYTANIESKQG